MDKVETTAFFFAALAVLSLIACSSCPIGNASQLIIVPDDYPNLAEAIEHATEGATIEIKSGVYDGPVNQTVFINKALSIVGGGREETHIDFYPRPSYETASINGEPFVLLDKSLVVNASGVKISGLTLDISDEVKVFPGGDVSLLANRTQILKCWLRGRLMVYGSDDIVEGCILTDSTWLLGENQSLLESAIHGELYCTSTTNSTVTGNTISEGGLTLRGSGNTIAGNIALQMSADNSNFNIIANNSLSFLGLIDDGQGGCSNNMVYGNIITGPGLIYKGIYVESGSGNVFHDNNITGHRSNNPKIREACGLSIRTHLVNENNLFYRNNFINNDCNVRYSGRPLSTGDSWDNGVEGNYWSDYLGADIDDDGIGDQPYVIDLNNQDSHPLMQPAATQNLNHRLPDATLSPSASPQPSTEPSVAPATTTPTLTSTNTLATTPTPTSSQKPATLSETPSEPTSPAPSTSGSVTPSIPLYASDPVGIELFLIAVIVAALIVAAAIAILVRLRKR